MLFELLVHLLRHALLLQEVGDLLRVLPHLYGYERVECLEDEAVDFEQHDNFADDWCLVATIVELALGERSNELVLLLLLAGQGVEITFSADFLEEVRAELVIG